MRNWQTSPDAKNKFAVEGGVVWIKLTQGQETCVDLEDWPRVRGFRWYAHRGRHTFYSASGGSRGIPLIRLHALILGLGTDHRDCDGLNNRRENLRGASTTDNLANSRKRSGCTSRFKGVHKHVDGKWSVQIAHTHVGLFEDEVAAAKTYDKKAKELFGEFARPNFAEGSV